MELMTAIFYVSVAYICWKVVGHCLSLPRISNLDSLFILITGCDSGFGHEAAKRLDAMGCQVIAGCLTEKGETILRKECSDRLRTIYLDVSKRESVQQAFDLVSAMLPRDSGLWGLVNNAGIMGKAAPESWKTLEDYRDICAVNLFGLIDVTKTFLPLVKKARGRIVNTASVLGRSAFINVPYAVSKYGVEAFSDCMRQNLRCHGVSVHIMEPGFFKTNLITFDESRLSEIRQHYHSLPEETKREVGEPFVDTLINRMRNIHKAPIVNQDTSVVVNAYIHALTARFPRARYVLGKDAKVWLAIEMLPEWLRDRIFGFIFKG